MNKYMTLWKKSFCIMSTLKSHLLMMLLHLCPCVDAANMQWCCSRWTDAVGVFFNFTSGCAAESRTCHACFFFILKAAADARRIKSIHELAEQTNLGTEKSDFIIRACFITRMDLLHFHQVQVSLQIRRSSSCPRAASRQVQIFICLFYYFRSKCPSAASQCWGDRPPRGEEVKRGGTDEGSVKRPTPPPLSPPPPSPPDWKIIIPADRLRGERMRNKAGYQLFPPHTQFSVSKWRANWATIHMQTSRIWYSEVCCAVPLNCPFFRERINLY